MTYSIQEILAIANENDNFQFPVLDDRKSEVLDHILKCKTPYMGGHLPICDDCHNETIHYNSCRDRHCPCCGAVVKEQWIDKTKASLVDAPYHHVVFTLPHELNQIFMCNDKIMYDLFYKCVAETLKVLSKDPKHKIEAEVGFISILHTWGQNLSYHPHIHVIFLAGGLRNQSFVKYTEEFLFPFSVVSSLFKGKLLDHIDKLWRKNKLDYKPISDTEFSKLKSNLYEKNGKFTPKKLLIAQSMSSNT